MSDDKAETIILKKGISLTYERKDGKKVVGEWIWSILIELFYGNYFKENKQTKSVQHIKAYLFWNYIRRKKVCWKKRWYD